MLASDTTRKINRLDGRYDFGIVSLETDQITIREQQKPGWTASGSTQRSFVVSELGCPDQLIENFGNTCETRIEGLKFDDRDEDGEHDPTEPGLNGWTIRLLDAEGTELATDVTRRISGKNGRYNFGQVRLDPRWERLVIREQQQPGWTAVGPEQREFVVEELIRDLDCPAQIGVDFANRRTGSVSEPDTHADADRGSKPHCAR